MKYKFKDMTASRIKADVDVVAAEFDRIIGKYGGLTPTLVVKEARKKRNPLHDLFEWNDKEAAEMYRETQARYIIRSIEVVTEVEDEEPIHVRAYHSVVTEDNNRIYTTVENARNDPDLWEQVVEKALLEIKNWRETYKQITAFGDLFGAIDGL